MHKRPSHPFLPAKVSLHGESKKEVLRLSAASFGGFKVDIIEMCKHDTAFVHLMLNFSASGFIPFFI